MGERFSVDLIASKTHPKNVKAPRKEIERHTEEEKLSRSASPPVPSFSNKQDHFRHTLVRVSGNDVSRGVSNHLSNFLFNSKEKEQFRAGLSFCEGVVPMCGKDFFSPPYGRTLSLFLFLVVEESCCWRRDGQGRVVARGLGGLICYR
jgi:hypothetical protein